MNANEPLAIMKGAAVNYLCSAGPQSPRPLRRAARVTAMASAAVEELALARRWSDPHTVGASLRVLGLVEGGKKGIGRLREAVEVLAGSEARLEHVRALVDLGAALRRANRRTEARE